MYQLIYQPTDVKCSKNAIIILRSNNSYNDSNYVAWLLRETGSEISASGMFNLELQNQGAFGGAWAAPFHPCWASRSLYFLQQAGGSGLLCFKPSVCSEVNRAGEL